MRSADLRPSPDASNRSITGSMAKHYCRHREFAWLSRRRFLGCRRVAPAAPGHSEHCAGASSADDRRYLMPVRFSAAQACFDSQYIFAVGVNRLVSSRVPAQILVRPVSSLYIMIGEPQSRQNVLVQRPSRCSARLGVNHRITGHRDRTGRAPAFSLVPRSPDRRTHLHPYSFRHRKAHDHLP
jgi:hypothetical protein